MNTLKRLDKHPVFPNVKIVHSAAAQGLAEASEDMQTVVINPAVPTTINVNGKRVPTAAPLAVRELYTRAGCEVFREAAQKAGHQADEEDIHACGDEQAGQVAEAQFLREKFKFTDQDLATYARIMADIEAKLGAPAMRRGGPVRRRGGGGSKKSEQPPPEEDNPTDAAAMSPQPQPLEDPLAGSPQPVSAPMTEEPIE